MPGLEIHTLNQVETELPELLLARASAVAAGDTIPSATEKAPDYAGAFSLGRDVVYSVLGDELLNPDAMAEKKERLAMYPIPLGTLAASSTISMKTGCWSIVDAWRDEKGYAFIWHPEEYGYEVDRSKSFLGISVHRMAYNMKRRATGLPDLTRRQQLDHICRWPGCCNIDHLNIVDHTKNNKLRDQARVLEAALFSGQIILGPTGSDWLDKPLEESETPETNLIISTPTGLFRIIKVDNDPLMFRGQQETSDLLDIVQPPAPKKYERPSRAKRVKVDADQKPLFDPADYKGRRPRKADLYKKWQKEGEI